MADDEKKIIIDEDWKSQVEAEREAARKQDAEPEAQPDAPQEATPDADPQAPDDYEMPPASFSMLVTSFATQTEMKVHVILVAPSGACFNLTSKNHATAKIDTHLSANCLSVYISAESMKFDL